MAGRRTSVYLNERVADALEASGRQLAEVIATGLGIEPEPTEATLRRVIREELAGVSLAAGPDLAASLRCESCGGELACPRCYTDENACA